MSAFGAVLTMGIVVLRHTASVSSAGRSQLHGPAGSGFGQRVLRRKCCLGFYVVVMAPAWAWVRLALMLREPLGGNGTNVVLAMLYCLVDHYEAADVSATKKR